MWQGTNKAGGEAWWHSPEKVPWSTLFWSFMEKNGFLFAHVLPTSCKLFVHPFSKCFKSILLTSLYGCLQMQAKNYNIIIPIIVGINIGVLLLIPGSRVGPCKIVNRYGGRLSSHTLVVNFAGPYYLPFFIFYFSCFVFLFALLS